MTRSKLTRRALALRLFAIALFVNGLLLLVFWPSPAKTAPERDVPADLVEVQIRGILATSFLAGKKIILMTDQGQQLGPVYLAENGDHGAIVHAPRALYATHYKQLITREWVMMPFDEDLMLLKPVQEDKYEIRY